jgi:soluble lytic murein transglycosylase-like protein
LNNDPHDTLSEITASMSSNRFVPRTSPFRILQFLFLISLAFSYGIYATRTLAPTHAVYANVASEESCATAPAVSTAASGSVALDKIILTAGARHGVDPRLIHAVIWKESNYRQHARSSQGAQGLMQLTAPTAARFGCRNASDPAANVEAGTRYLRTLLERFNGDVSLALAGYNAGEGSVSKYRGIPPFPETRNYVRKIVSRYGKSHHPLV